jgi:hypothetical protein
VDNEGGLHLSVILQRCCYLWFTYQPRCPCNTLHISKYIIVPSSALPCVGLGDDEDKVECQADWCCPFLLKLIPAVRLKLFGKPEQKVVRIQVVFETIGERLASHVLGHFVDRKLRLKTATGISPAKGQKFQDRGESSRLNDWEAVQGVVWSAVQKAVRVQ